MKLADRWKAYRRIVEVPSPSDKLGDEMADLLEECEQIISNAIKYHQLIARIHELEAERDRWGALCEPIVYRPMEELLARLRAQEEADE